MPEKDFYKLYKKYKRKSKQKNRTLLAEMDLVSLGGGRIDTKVSKYEWTRSLPKLLQDNAVFKSYFKVGRHDDVFLGQNKDYEKVYLSNLIALLGNQNESVHQEALRILNTWAGVGRIDSPEPKKYKQDERAAGKSWFEYIKPQILLRYYYLVADKPEIYTNGGWWSLS